MDSSDLQSDVAEAICVRVDAEETYYSAKSKSDHLKGESWKEHVERCDVFKHNNAGQELVEESHAAHIARCKEIDFQFDLDLMKSDVDEARIKEQEALQELRAFYEKDTKFWECEVCKISINVHSFQTHVCFNK